MPIIVALSLLAATTFGIAVWRLVMQHRSFRRRLQLSLNSASDGETSLLVAAESLSSRLSNLNDDADRLEAAIEVSPMGVVIVDTANQDVILNGAANSFATGRAGDAVIGLRLRELITEVNRTGESAEHEFEVFTPTQRTVRLRAMPLIVHGEQIGTAAFADDLTLRSTIDEIRRDFVANASHELKTPLGALRLLSEALVTTNDPAKQESLGTRIQAEATRMTRLVEDILDLSLIEQHKSVRGVVDLREVAQEAIQQVALNAETLGVPIESDCEPVDVLGDHRRLVSALANLIENAINYTSPKGTDLIEPVTVRSYRRGADAIIEVEDRGIGIAERHQARVFERFYRIDQGRSRERGGTGLGLAIVRHVVRNHWGEIELESIPGKGSTFRIVLPGREK